jgi:hypothetical protein
MDAECAPRLAYLQAAMLNRIPGLIELRLALGQTAADRCARQFRVELREAEMRYSPEKEPSETHNLESGGGESRIQHRDFRKPAVKLNLSTASLARASARHPWRRLGARLTIIGRSM